MNEKKRPAQFFAILDWRGGLAVNNFIGHVRNEQVSDKLIACLQCNCMYLVR